MEWEQANEAHATRHGVSVAESGDYLAEGTTTAADAYGSWCPTTPARRVLRPIAEWEMR